MRDAYADSIRSLRTSRKLHAAVQRRLETLLGRIHPDAAVLSEVVAVLGGRNDLMMFSFNGRRVAFELFASASQVPQDLRLLEQCGANVTIAIIIDHDVDSKVSSQYFHKKPQAFPFLWTRQILDPRFELYAIARLKELTDERSSLVRLRKLVETRYGLAVDRAMGPILDSVEARLPAQRISKPSRLTGTQVISLRIVSLLMAKGIPQERLRSLYQWLLQGLDFGLTLLACGFQAFLITDLEAGHAIWSDGDLADDLIIMTPETAEAQVVICLNPIINGFLKSSGVKPFALKYHFSHMYEEFVRVAGQKPKGSRRKSTGRRSVKT